MVNKKKIFF